jgi:hypothetical protein
MSSASCDLFDKVDDVTFTVALDQVFHIDETAVSDSPVEYTNLQLLDAAKVNTDFDKYKDKFKSITITQITYKVTNVATADVIFTNGNAGFSGASANVPSELASLGIESPKAAEGQVKNLPFTQAALDELANLLKNDKKANLYTVGTFSKTPAKFDVTFTVNATVVANALK